MGVIYMARNRQKTKMLGGRELILGEVKALRYVREHRRHPAPPEELAELDVEIRRMEGVQLGEDFDILRGANRLALVKLTKPGARLTHDERVHLIAWVDVVDRIRREHRDTFHIAQLLALGDGGDPILRDLDLAYLFLAVVSNAERYRELGYVGGDWDKPLPHLDEALAGLTAGPLGEHLADGRWFGPPRALRSLPEDPIQRSRILGLYAEYLELATVANAYVDFGGLDLPALKDGPKLPNYATLRLEEDPGVRIQDTVEELSRRLEGHLGSAAE
jgi:hypothetical protein